MGNKEKIESTYTVVGYPGQSFPSQYVNYVRARWMRSYRFGNDFIRLIDSDAYFTSYTYYLTGLLFRPDAFIRLAVLTDTPDVALGFSVCRDGILDYIHVHKDYRKIGIGKKLMPPGIKIFTHLTKTGMKLWPTKLADAKFNPFA